jgi:hypothetical protein
MRTRISLLAVLFLVSATANAENSVVLTQKSPPLKITKYLATYQEESSGTYSSHPDQIRHAVTCQNVSGKIIVAYQIGLVAFDAFQRLHDQVQRMVYRKDRP